MYDGFAPYPLDHPAVELPELPGPDWNIFTFLDQDEWWKPRDLAAAVRVVDLEPDHRRKLLAFLRRNAGGYTAQLFGLAMSWMLTARGEIAQMDAERACARAWIDDQPLVERLVELEEAAARTGAGPEWWES